MKGHQKKYQNEYFAKNGRENFPGYTMMRKRRKCFALFARKQRKKIHLQVVDTSTVTKHAANTDYVRVRGSKHYNRVIV